mgnify:CR=1 FL=1
MARKKKIINNALPSHPDAQIQQSAMASYYTSLASDTISTTDSYSRSGRNANPNVLEGRFKEIECSLQPFCYKSGGSYISARDVIDLPIKAYWAFGLLRQVVETMCELASSKIYLKGSSKKTKAFVETWLEKINITKFSQEFFREYYRSANCFIYEYTAKIKPEDIKELDTFYSGVGDGIPLKYILLPPVNLCAKASLFSANPSYLVSLDRFQAEALKNPQTQEDKAIFDSLSDAEKKNLKEGGYLSLDPKKLTKILYKAQSYEFFGVPLAFPVLEQINAHLELQKIDMAVARTTDRLLLMITMGREATEYDKTTVNPAAMDAVRQMFASGAISRTLVATYDVKGEWLVPDINKILGQQKYENLEKQISVGLNAIFFSENEKFANSSIKVQIFIQKLQEARESFIKNFLQKEVNKICKIINSKSAPEVHFEDISLKDELEWAKLSAQLYSIGVLTAEEALENIQSGKFPTPEESLESQAEFKSQKESGLYTPVVGNSVQQQAEQMKINQELGIQTLQQDAKLAEVSGRPTGTKSPQSTKKVSPIGASEGYSFESLKEISWAVSDLQDSIEKALQKKFKVKSLDDSQLSMSKQLTESIIGNEPIDSWNKKIKEYIKEPKQLKEETANEIDELCLTYGISSYAASMLRLSIIK